MPSPPYRLRAGPGLQIHLAPLLHRRGPGPQQLELHHVLDSRDLECTRAILCAAGARMEPLPGEKAAGASPAWTAVLEAARTRP